MKSPDVMGSLTPLLSPVASPQPLGAVGSFGQGMMPHSSGMVYILWHDAVGCLKLKSII